MDVYCTLCHVNVQELVRLKTLDMRFDAEGFNDQDASIGFSKRLLAANILGIEDY